MRYEEGKIDQFESNSRFITDLEARQIISDFQFRGREALPNAFKDIKDHILGEDDSYIDDVEREYAARRGEQVPEKKKKRIFPIVVVIVLFVMIPLLKIFIGPTAMISVFFGAFGLLGFYSAFRPSPGQTSSNYYDGQTSTGNKKNGIFIGIVGLAGMVPLFLTKAVGTNQAFLLMGVSLFTVVGLFMIFGFFGSLSIKNRKYRENVNARCIGYVREVDSRDGGENGANRYFLKTSPIFEYSYEGRTYKSIYDRMINGKDADVDLGSTMINIDPDHPEDIFRKAVKVNVMGFFWGLVCIGIAVLLFTAFRNGGTLNLKGSIRYTPGEGITIDDGSVDPDEPIFDPDRDVMEQVAEMMPENITDTDVAQFARADQWYYETVRVEEIFTYDDDNYSIEFEGDDFTQVSRNGDPSNIHDEVIVFYSIFDIEYEGEIKHVKDPFIIVNADEHTYTGTHGAYEG
ncbi:MAG: hypothetical protein J5685_00090 [Clostridiales bacterium]|nr:hypothetical protein [Clostridiales bacterium]